MYYAFESKRVVLEIQLEPGFEGAQITCDVEARPPNSCAQSLVCSSL